MALTLLSLAAALIDLIIGPEAALPELVMPLPESEPVTIAPATSTMAKAGPVRGPETYWAVGSVLVAPKDKFSAVAADVPRPSEPMPANIDSMRHKQANTGNKKPSNTPPSA